MCCCVNCHLNIYFLANESFLSFANWNVSVDRVQLQFAHRAFMAFCNRNVKITYVISSSETALMSIIVDSLVGIFSVGGALSNSCACMLFVDFHCVFCQLIHSFFMN